MSFRRLAVVFVALLLAALLFHPPLLQGVALLLLVDRPDPAQSADNGRRHSILILGGDRRHDRAAELLRDGDGMVLLIEAAPTRLVDLGVLPPPHELVRQQLLQRGVPDSRIHLIEGAARDDWQRARLLGRWLRQHRAARVTVLCDRFETRRLQHVLASVLPDPLCQRVVVRGLADRRYDETNWWKSRTGLKSLFNSTLNLIYARWVGENQPPPVPWDPDEFEKSLSVKRNRGV